MTTRASGWAAWARRLKAKHGRADWQRKSLAMTLLHARFGVSVSHTVSPRVWVTVRPDVRAMAAAQPAPVVVQAVPKQVLLQRETRIERVREPGAVVVRRDRTSVLQGESFTVRAHCHRLESTVFHESIARQVWRKTRAVEDFARTRRLRTVMSLAADAPLNRVLRQATRQEQPPAPLPMVVRPVQPPAGPRVDFSAEDPAAIAAMPQRNSVPFAVAPAEPNLDAITTHVMDRIDRRLIAWRERMGKF